MPTEQLSIPELIKRLITYEAVASKLNLNAHEIPQSFHELNRFEDKRWTGWFQGDGGSIGKYLRNIASFGKEAETLTQFSQAMLDWGKNSLKPAVEKNLGRVIYAGGDDFLDVLYRSVPVSELTAQECLNWFYTFPEIWSQHEQNITVSVGFVWAAGAYLSGMCCNTAVKLKNRLKTMDAIALPCEFTPEVPILTQH